jgi:hypothetical protein
MKRKRGRRGSESELGECEREINRDGWRAREEKEGERWREREMERSRDGERWRSRTREAKEREGEGVVREGGRNNYRDRQTDRQTDI